MNRKTTLLSCLTSVFILMLVGCSTVGPLCRSDEKVRVDIEADASPCLLNRFRPIAQHGHNFGDAGALAIAHVIAAGGASQQHAAFVVEAEELA